MSKPNELQSIRSAVVDSADPEESHQVDDEDSHQVGDFRRKLQENPHDKDLPPSPLSRRAQQVLIAVFLGIIAVGLFFVVIDRWRRGTTAIGAGMLFFAVIRWLVDSEVMSILAVRSRKFDSIFSATLAVAMMYLAISVDTLGS